MSGIMQMLLAATASAVAVTDSLFNYVTLLLNTNSTNNSTNNAILYSSSPSIGYAGTVTRNGNVTQGTFTPFSPAGWSCAFPSGSSNFITVADNSTLRFG